MNRVTSIVPSLLGSFFIGGSALADPLEQTQVSYTQGALNTWNADWAGVSGRTYFVQISTDLMNWSFAPSVNFGSGLKSLGVDSGGVPKFFLRLKYVDEGWITTLQQARDADLDGDGIPNWYEVETLGTDPFNKASAGGDTDADGLADGWEMFYFGGLAVANPTVSLKPDGLTNKQKNDWGLSPMIDYSTAPPTSSGSGGYSYDATGRLVSFTAPVGAASFDPDEEGNINSAE